MKSWLNQSISIPGILFASLAAIGYTAANSFKRCLADTTPPELVVTAKALFTSVVFLPVLGWLLMRERKQAATETADPGLPAVANPGSKVIPPWPILLLLMAAAVIVQFGGNLAFQLSLAISAWRFPFHC